MTEVGRAQKVATFCTARRARGMYPTKVSGTNKLMNNNIFYIIGVIVVIVVVLKLIGLW